MTQQNFGAILRSAYFLGAAGVLACKRNSAPLSGVVSKASAGALEQMPVHSCSNLPRTLQDARDSGWLVCPYSPPFTSASQELDKQRDMYRCGCGCGCGA